MKITLLLLTLFLTTILSFDLRAQQLDNTEWELYAPNNSLFGYHRFANDTMYARNIGSSLYTPSSIYQEVGSTFSISDLNPISCGSDTGHYSFIITNDTVNFTLSQDPCFVRSNFYANIIWKKLVVTNLNDATFQETLAPIFPNPSTNTITLPPVRRTSAYSIIDQKGSVILTGELTTREQNIDITNLFPGVYFLKSDNGEVKSQRFIKQ